MPDRRAYSSALGVDIGCAGVTGAWPSKSKSIDTEKTTVIRYGGVALQRIHWIAQDDRLMSDNKETVVNPGARVAPIRGVIVLAGLIFSVPAFAYIGPGAGLSAIGSVLALVGAVLLMILGFIWYPVKRILAGRKQDPAPPDTDAEFSEGDETLQAGDDNIKQSTRV